MLGGKKTGAINIPGSGWIELSAVTVKNFQAEAKRLEVFLTNTGRCKSIKKYLNNTDDIGCSDVPFMDELLNWGFEGLSTKEGFAWLLQIYSD